MFKEKNWLDTSWKKCASGETKNKGADQQIKGFIHNKQKKSTSFRASRQTKKKRHSVPCGFTPMLVRGRS